ncbi:hypothetical protein CALCODRAFT_496405 [Calocera cornea HHB12733]|uniref:Uncharacterized protein n=1 Tax=Calocera cornea HHB12733 TaxID=1353952 RepID=A0A165FW03_9BASI|nr:hypothetical protein CALCODRAFT_496405 [Calocera cornea HHB12733]
MSRRAVLYHLVPVCELHPFVWLVIRTCWCVVLLFLSPSVDLSSGRVYKALEHCAVLRPQFLLSRSHPVPAIVLKPSPLAPSSRSCFSTWCN